MRAREACSTAVMTAACLATNYALVGVPNVKLMDLLVFASGFLFGTKVGVSAECIYRDGSLVNLQFISRGARGFGLLAHTSQGHLYHELDLGTCYRDGFKVFHRMFRTGDWPLTPGQLVRPVEVTAAVVEACESGREVRLGRMMREAAPAAGR